jgi:hypothetical protein
MKKSLFWMLSALAVTGLFSLAACDEDESEEIPACAEGNNPCEGTTSPYCHPVGTTPVCSIIEKCDAGMTMGLDGRCADNTLGGEGAACSNSDECQSGLSCYNNQCSSAAEVEDYKYVRIDDMSPKCETDSNGKCKSSEDPGADIDAIALIKSDGSVSYAASVKGYGRSDDTPSAKADNEMAVNPERALREPDSFIHYPNDKDGICYYWKQDTNPTTNNAERTYVSLGGKGGYLIVQMANSIVAGDKIDVLELGDCTLYNTSSKPGAEAGKAKDNEEIQVQVSVSGDVSGDWKTIGTGKATKGVISFDTTGKF